MISPLAYVSPKAQLGKNVTIDAFAYIDDNVILGDNCHVFPNAVVGCIPQDLKFKGEETWTIIGDNCVIRECATIHRGTASRGKTVVGNNNLIMAYCHVAHDCVLGNNIIMSNVTQLAGEVEIDDFAVIGGGTLVHQFTRIGAHVMIQGGSKVGKDVPPYIIAAREPLSFYGINSVGLNRRGFTPEQIHTIQEVYRLLYQGGMNTTQALDHIVATMPASAERDLIVNFVKASTRGVVRA